MGYNTSYLGRFDVEPSLNGAEVEWLRAYSRTFRPAGGDDPYGVPMNPGAELPADTATTFERCDWVPCLDGCCLSWRPAERSNNASVDLQYLIDHFLRPGAHAAADGRPDFEPFTFDHHVSGIVAAENGETRELFLLVADDNVIDERTLVPGDPYPW